MTMMYIYISNSIKGHYSTWKAAAFLGIGTDQVISLKTDGRGRIIPDDFTQKIQKCKAEVPGSIINKIESIRSNGFFTNLYTMISCVYVSVFVSVCLSYRKHIVRHIHMHIMCVCFCHFTHR